MDDDENDDYKSADDKDSGSDDGQFTNFASSNRFSALITSKKKPDPPPPPSSFNLFRLQNALKNEAKRSDSEASGWGKPSESNENSNSPMRSGSLTSNASGSSRGRTACFTGAVANGNFVSAPSPENPDDLDSGIWQCVGEAQGKGATFEQSDNHLPPRLRKKSRGRENMESTWGPRRGQHRTSSCPYDVRFICHSCFKNGGAVVYQNGSYCGSRNSTHTWERHKGLAVMDGNGKAYLLRDLPRSVSQEHQRGNRTPVMRMCKRIQQYGKCSFHDCGFAHNDMERRCWNWLLKSGQDLYDVAKQNEESGYTVASANQRKASFKASAPPPSARGGSYSSIARRVHLVPATVRGAVNGPSAASISVAPINRQAAPQMVRLGAQPMFQLVRAGGHPSIRPPAATLATRASAMNSSMENTVAQPPPDEIEEEEIITFYCYLCNKTLNDELVCDDHVASELHQSRHRLVEEGRIWSYRTPPGPPPFRPCDKHTNGETCPYSTSPHNHCLNAHSREELTEWTERLEILERALVQKSDKDMNQLKEIIRGELARGKTILSPCRDDVDISCKENQQAAMAEKGKPFVWTFALIAEKRLHRVILLDQDSAKCFRLHSPFSTIQNKDIVLGDAFADDTLEGFYEVKVEFIGSSLSQTFTQRVAFDFGDVPIVYRELVVHSGLDHLALLQQNSLRHLLSAGGRHWTPENAEIHWVSKERSVERINIANVVANLNFTINEANYFSLLKQWLFAEEYRRQAILDDLDFNKIRINVVSQLTTELGDTHFAKEGSYFAAVPFKRVMTEDMDAVILLREYCQHAFLARSRYTDKGYGGRKLKVYEVDIMNKFHSKIDAVFTEGLYLQLTPVVIRHMALQPGVTIDLDIQFNLDTKQFRQWLRGLEVLHENQLTPLIFPDLLGDYRNYVTGKMFEENRAKIQEIQYLTEQWKRDHNPEQYQVMEHVVYCAMENKKWTPPLVVFGPFGTGKTRTIAAAAATLLTNKDFEHTRILICTHANTTADIYIKLLLERTRMTRDQLRSILWRLAHRHASIEKDEYIRFDYDDQTGTYYAAKLTLEALRKIRVLICTFESSEKILKILDKAGEEREKVAFTHIFIDEAAQALEVETVLPLCVAKRSTCVVVAGDHHQIRPTVYLTQAKELSQSYLERLYYHYDKQKSSVAASFKKGRIPSILFNKNYRCHPEILSFLSSEFYGDPKCLAPCAAPCDNSVVKPLYFVASDSNEEVGPNGSLCNRGEARAVAEQVWNLWNNWPRAWGDKSIGVAVPYVEQGFLIRKELQNLRISTHPNAVDVTRVIQMQGKEYKALIISTVRGGPSLLEAVQVEDASGRPRNLGFLDDARLINTAMTRAKYTVVVVGNPTGLCVLGACRDTWYRYVETCARNDALLPLSVTWYDLDQKIGIARADSDAMVKRGDKKKVTAEDLLLQQLTKKSQREGK